MLCWQVDGDPVPVPHFGVALSVPEFHALAARLQAVPGFKFVIEPHLRFEVRHTGIASSDSGCQGPAHGA